MSQNKSLCECVHWARTETRLICGEIIPTNHHPNCPHYNDSLMDVWRVQVGGTSCYVDNEQDAKDSVGDEAAEDSSSITKETMHREVFENLPEFNGF